MLDAEIPSLVIIGNTAYDIIDFSKVNPTRENIIDVGGACIFSAIPSSLFYRVGVVSKVGSDFNLSEITKFNIDFSGMKVLDTQTTKFYTIWNSIDGQDRRVVGEVEDIMEIKSEDIPCHFLKAKHIHLTTAKPSNQLDMIKYLKKNFLGSISVDTIDEYSKETTCKEVFDLVDIAFIDREYTNLLDCDAKIKIIKNGKTGCTYYSDEGNFSVFSNIIDNVVDKTGAGDCLNGVFLNLILNGVPSQKALKIAVDVATESIKDKGILSLNVDKIKEKYLLI